MTKLCHLAVLFLSPNFCRYAPLITVFWTLPGNSPINSPQFPDYFFTTTSLTDGNTSHQRGLCARYLPGGIPPFYRSVTTLLLSLRKALSSPPETDLILHIFKASEGF